MWADFVVLYCREAFPSVTDPSMEVELRIALVNRSHPNLKKKKKKKKNQKNQHKDICQSSIYLLEKKNRSSRKKEKSIIETLKKIVHPERVQHRSVVEQSSIFSKKTVRPGKKEKLASRSLSIAIICCLSYWGKNRSSRKKIKPTLNHLSLVRINLKSRIGFSVKYAFSYSFMCSKNRSSRKKYRKEENASITISIHHCLPY